MRTARNKAFTMVELLMVIMIISILVTLVVPGIIRAVELGKQAACNTNIKVIIQGLNQYSNVSEEMPKVPVSSWNVAIGKNRNARPFAEPGRPELAPTERNHSANLWLLVREEHVSVAAFVCPATTDIPSQYQKVEDYWDFYRSEYISYGIQSPYGWDGSLTVLTPRGVVLIADGSPYVEPSAGNDPGKIKKKGDLHIVDWGRSAGDILDGDTMKLYGNSPNHDSEGQNIGYSDGHAEWQEVAACGRDGDNIYTANDEADPKERRTATDAEGHLDVTRAGGIKNNENDTLILP